MSLKKTLRPPLQDTEEPLHPDPVPQRPVVVLQPELPEGPRVPRAPVRDGQLVSTSMAAHAWTSRPFTLSTASSQSTATGLLSLGGMVHPTDPSARPVQHRGVGRLPPAAILHRVGYLPRGEASHAEVERVRLLLDRYFMPLEYTEGADHPIQLPYRVEVERVCMWAGGDGPPIWAYPTNTPAGSR